MTEKKKTLVTSALPYANGPLHLGHIAGAYLPADIYVRYLRLKKRDVVYICGSDEHGVPITVTADKEKITPQDVVDRYHAMNKEAFEKLGISFDNYSRTSLPVHHETAQDFFTTLFDKGDLIVKEDKQFYSEKAQRFLPDRYVEGECPHCGYDRARGDQCDKCGKWLETGELKNPKSKIDGSTPVLRSTKHWYLPMGRFAGAWKTWFDSHQWKDNVMNYCMGWYKEGLGDRPITRDLHWGVDVPLEDAEGKVLYVWFDAPIGYISSTKEWAQNIGDPDRWKSYWQDENTRLVHFIGKDNVVFHAILFPMMLMEKGGYVLPEAIPANEYLTIEGRKISTSQNYAIWVRDYLETFPPDPLRYTLAANAPEGKDTDFSWAQFQSRNNDELADILGNFINRTVTFVHKYFDGQVPARSKMLAADALMLETVDVTKKKMEDALEKFEVRKAMRIFMDLGRAANKYFNDSQPWATRKTDLESCATTLNVCVQVARGLAVLMAPVLYNSSETLKSILNVPGEWHWDGVGFDEIPEGHTLGKAEILFSKIEDDVIEKEVQKLKKLSSGEADTSAESEDQIEFSEFQKVQLKTARVLEVEKVKGADKLYCLQIELGGEKRQIVAGIAQHYTPEELLGKTVIVVANLKPATIRGVKSQGMLLAVKSGKSLTVLTPDRETDSGLLVS